MNTNIQTLYNHNSITSTLIQGVSEPLLHNNSKYQLKLFINMVISYCHGLHLQGLFFLTGAISAISEDIDSSSWQTLAPHQAAVSFTQQTHAPYHQGQYYKVNKKGEHIPVSDHKFVTLCLAVSKTLAVNCLLIVKLVKIGERLNTKHY